MTREEFLRIIFNRYKSFFTEDTVTDWLVDYKIVLSEDLDYEKLRGYVTRNWSNPLRPPSPQWLRGFLSSVKKPEPSPVVVWKTEERGEMPPCVEEMKRNLWNRGLVPKDIDISELKSWHTRECG